MSNTQFIGNVIYANITQQPAAGLGVRDGPGARHGHLPAARAPDSARSSTYETQPSLEIAAARCVAAVTLAFIYVPLIVIGIYAFNSSNILKWPPPGLTTHWFAAGVRQPAARAARWSPRSRSDWCATAIALVLGTLASLAVARHRFFGRETISFLVILPDRAAGDRHRRRALSDTFTQVLGVPPQPAHRRSSAMPPSASSSSTTTSSPGCGGPPDRSRRRRPTSARDPWQTFRFVTLPVDAIGAGRRRAAGLRTVLRRDHRHRCSPSAPARRPCRSGSSTTSSDPTSSRSSTWWPCWSSSPRFPSTSPTG